MSKLKHTALPWAHDEDRYKIISTVEWDIEPDEKYDEEGVKKTIIILYGACGENVEGNIALIIKAVNHHKALVNALKETYRHLPYGHEALGIMVQDILKSIEQEEKQCLK